MTATGEEAVSHRRQLSDRVVVAGRGVGTASAMLNHAVAERLGLHPTDWECVAVLVDRGPLTAGQLAEVTGLTTGAVTGLIDRLEAGGYVRRARDPADRRRVLVELLPERFGEAVPVFAPMLADMVASHEAYTDDELELIAKALTRAAEILRDHAIRIRAETAAGRVRGV